MFGLWKPTGEHRGQVYSLALTDIHSSDLREPSGWFWHDDSTINMVLVIVIVLSGNLFPLIA